MEGMRRVQAIARGVVQGVGYRETMRRVAVEAGASGWVRNRRDGSVEAEIEGTSVQVDEVLAWMVEGPPAAIVDDVQVQDIRLLSSTGFEVRPSA